MNFIKPFALHVFSAILLLFFLEVDGDTLQSSPLKADTASNLYDDTLQIPPPLPGQESGIMDTMSADSFPSKITKVFIKGNRVTRADIIKIYVGLDTGMTYDSVLAAAGKRRLLNTDLFSKVDIFPVRMRDGINMYIIVTELFYLIPSAGGDYYGKRYGSNFLWYRLCVGLGIQNFRGRFESFSIRASVWEDKSFGISWSKPLAPSPYFFGIGADIREYPDLNFPWRRLTINGGVSVGRTILSPFDKSRISLSIIPTYSLVTSTVDNRLVKKFKEVYTNAGWSIDRKDRSFDPQKGWSMYAGVSTNAFCTDYMPYLQLNSTLRLYHRGFFQADRFAYRVQTALRSNDGGIFQGLYIGGQSTIRGFAQDEIGIPSSRNGFIVMNDYIAASSEYRFSLWTTPSVEDLLSPDFFEALKKIYHWLSPDYIDILKDFYVRFDGAVFVDAGHIWNNVVHPFIQAENGVGFGAGLRAMAPTLRRSLGFDVAWGAIPHSKRPYLDFLSQPTWQLYLDLYF